MIISNIGGGGGVGKKGTEQIISSVNTDSEPLNFLNYIYDISVFGAESYVMDKSNEGLWRQLITNSLTMFGHDAIHEYIYNRLTDEDVDYMLTNNARLGQSFNSFYNTDVFPAGTIDDVLKTLTADTYNILELKIQQGINRYIEGFTGKETGVGTWLNSLFVLDNADLAACQSLNDIVSSTSLLESLLTSEPVCMVLVNNAALYKIQMEDILFNQLITYIASSTTATTALIVSSIAGNTWGGGIS